jgi:ATP-dependent Zn protease
MGHHIIYPRLSDVSKEQIDNAVFTIVTQKYIEVRDYLVTHKELLQSMGRRLVKTKSLDIDDILKMMREYR